MTMQSHVEVTEFATKAHEVTDRGELIDSMAGPIGVPCIIGNFLYYNGKISMLWPNGETLVIAAPIEVQNTVLVHLAFGTENRRICHNMPIDDFEKIVSNFNTALALARLEERKDPPCSPKNKSSS